MIEISYTRFFWMKWFGNLCMQQTVKRGMLSQQLIVGNNECGWKKMPGVSGCQSYLYNLLAIFIVVSLKFQIGVNQCIVELWSIPCWQHSIRTVLPFLNCQKMYTKVWTNENKSLLFAFSVCLFVLCVCEHQRERETCYKYWNARVFCHCCGSGGGGECAVFTIAVLIKNEFTPQFILFNAFFALDSVIWIYVDVDDDMILIVVAVAAE